MFTSHNFLSNMKNWCKLIIFKLISFNFLCMPIITKATFCYNTEIRCPFWLKDGKPMPQGRSPAFGLYCDNNLKKPLLELPNAGNFTVDDISTYSREIQLVDPTNCLPQKLLLLDFNSTKSPFSLKATTQTKDYRLYNCSNWVIDNQLESYDDEKFDCLKGAEFSIISEEGFSYVDSSCTFVKNVSFQTTYSYMFSSMPPGSSVSSFDLSWEIQDCELSVYPDGTAPTVKISKVYLFPLIVAGLIIVLVILICAYCIFKACEPIRSSVEAPIVGDEAATNTTRELDSITINSYPLVVIGGSRHLIQPDEATCPICLSEYSPGETLKILQCVHRFHVDCIDQWLRAKASCPICRTSSPQTS